MSLDRVISYVEQSIEKLDLKLGALESRATAAAQSEVQLWSGARGVEPITTNCTFTGTAAACAGLGLGNAVVTVRNASTSALLWSGVADSSGNFSGSASIGATTITAAINIAPDPADPFASRFVAASTNKFLSPGSNSLGRVGLNLASGYACSQYAYYPLSTTLHLTDSFYGAATLTYTSGAPASWRGAHNISFPGCAATFCPTPATSAIRYDLFQLTQNMQMSFNSTGFCPNSTTGSFQNDSTVTLAVTTASPITLGVTVTLSSTLFCGRVVSFTCTE